MTLEGTGSGGPGRKVRVGVVGLGYWGPNLLRVLTDLPGVEVAALCDLSQERLARYGHRHPAAVTTTKYDDLLGDETIDAVFLATPVFTHFDLAARALRAGKHTFVEKPLAPSTELANQLLGLAAHKNLSLMCGHTFLYSPPVREIGGMLEREEVGDVFFISSSRVNLGLHQRDISVIWDLGPHDFSILLYWLGEMPHSVRAVGRDSIVPGIADVAFVTLTFPSGVVANVELSWLAPSKLRRTVLVGSKKMIVYDDGTAEPVRIYDRGVVYRDPETFGEYHLSYRTGDIISPKLSSQEPLSMELADFMTAIRDGRPRTQHTQIARDVVRVTEAAERSLLAGGDQVELAGSLRFARGAERIGRDRVTEATR